VSSNKKKPKVKLIGCDGNAWAIMSACRTAAREAGWSTEEWTTVKKEMMSGDYDHLLQVAMEHFDVR
jgi:hypothetical protein